MIELEGGFRLRHFEFFDFFFGEEDLGAEGDFFTLRILDAKDEDFLYIRNAGQVVFDLFGEDVLAVVEDDQVLLASGDEELPFFVEASEVAGVESAVRHEDFRREIGALVVAEHDGVALDADLTVPVLIRVFDGDVDAPERHPDGGAVVAFGLIDAHER